MGLDNPMQLSYFASLGDIVKMLLWILPASSRGGFAAAWGTEGHRSGCKCNPQ